MSNCILNAERHFFFWHKAEEGRMSAIGSVPDVTKAGERRHPAPMLEVR